MCTEAADGAAARTALVSHCLLNAGVKVADAPLSPASLMPLMALLQHQRYRLVQMPCPESTFFGARRWWLSYEQCDTPAYRLHCRDLARATIELVADDLRAGREVVILGVDGSPSSGVSITYRSPTWQGRPEGADDARYAPGQGIWIEALIAEALERGLPAPKLVGIGVDLPDRSPTSFVIDFQRRPRD